MKTDLQQLIDMAKELSDRLEIASQQEREFCLKLQIELEQMSWEMFRFMEDLKEIKQYVG